MSRRLKMLVSLGAAALLTGGAAGAGPAAQRRITAPVNWHVQSGAGAVDGASATLVTTASGASVQFRAAQLNPGHAYTLWWVVINNPQACQGHPDPCTARPDILDNSELTQSQITYATGHVAGDGGGATFAAHLPAGPVESGWLGDQGFTDPLGAEIHVVLNDHGPKLSDFMPGMIHTYRGGCTDESLPPFFPATAFADGEPGPNQCRLYQTAVFQ